MKPIRKIDAEKSAAEESGAGKPGIYEHEYSDESFWSKLTRFALAAGKEVVEKALWLYFAAARPDTPTWARATVYSALGYFILPTDAIPDLTPAVGFADDLGAITLAVATIAAYIDAEVKDKARGKIREWFGD